MAVIKRNIDGSWRAIVVGEPGPMGPVGPAGGDGGFYRHVQSLAASEWVINHNLSYNPGGITVVDSTGERVFGGISYPSSTQVVLTFQAAFSGEAYLS